jgi:copper chaperone CopZ
MMEKDMAEDEKELDVSVPSMVCDGCAEKIRTALTALPGVREVKVGLWRKRVRVRYEPARVEEGQLKETIAAAGFTVADA